MSYQIRKSDGTLLIDLADGTTDKSKTSITLVGKNVSSFGKDQNENFVRLVENFANTIQPSNSLTGQLWFNTSVNQLYVRTSTGFTSIGPFPAVTTPSITNTATNVIATTAFVHSIIPKGVILMWSGMIADIPSGWALCDGTAHNGMTTPDLRNKFVMGAGQNYAVGDVGGKVLLTEVPAHAHSFSGTTETNNVDHTHSGVSNVGGDHYHIFPGDDQLSYAAGSNGWTGTSDGGFPYDARSSYGGGGQMWRTTSANQHSHTFTTGRQSTGHNHDIEGLTSTNGSTTVNILNPYWALAYIIKVI